MLHASNVLVTNASLPATNVAELVKLVKSPLVKSPPGKFNYASTGIASPAHLASEMLNQVADNRQDRDRAGGLPAATALSEVPR